MIRFEWNDKNAEEHCRKHHITFEDAQQVFSDPFRISEPDNRYPYNEERWQTIGTAEKRCLLLFVAHTVLEEDDQEIIRIISARDATPLERKRYGNRKF
jgi:uncharacterized DUF497 family protein